MNRHDGLSLDTIAVHAGEPRTDGAATMPIYQSSTYEYRGGEAYHDIRYIRLNNTPNHEAVQQKLAALDGGESALVTGSGMAAISATFLALLGNGGHVLLQRGPYGGTAAILAQLAPFGATYDFIDADQPATWTTLVKASTRMIYVESMTNPLMEIPDFHAVVRFAKTHNMLSVIDATFATPVNLKPIELGFDLVLHSCTKYLNGHSDIVAGAVVGTGQLVTKVKHLLDYHGGSLDPHACFLLQRGMKTLGVRYRQQCQTTLAVARFLEKHPQIERTRYPMLESHPQHARAKEFFKVGGGGVVTFDVKGGSAAASAMIAKLRIPLHAPSLGGVESLVTCPAISTSASIPASERQRIGITDGLVRLSVGLEDPKDLIADLSQALS